MKKLEIIFKDKSKVTYTINRKGIDWRKYFCKHNKALIKSAILQEYPKKDNEPIVLI